MLQSLLHQRWSRKLTSMYQLYTVFSLVDKMTAENKIQFLGDNSEAVALAVKLLKNGEIIALPTDTVYGLACDASNSSAINLIYAIKGRDKNKPLAICVSCVGEIKKWGVTDSLPKGLLEALLPGPVTVLLNRTEKLNPDLNPGVKKVGIRIPNESEYPFIPYVTERLCYPLALTSANPSNEPNCICVDEFKPLWPKLGAVFDTNLNNLKEKNKSREGSTIVDLSEAGKFIITRNGVAYMQTVKILELFGLKISV